MQGMRVSEWIALGYFVYLALLAVSRRATLTHRADRVIATSCLATASVLILSTQPDGASVARDWIPFVWLVAGYWLPALLVEAPNRAFEQRLLNCDRRIFGPNGPTRFSGLSAQLFEGAYLFCYPLVPLGFVCLRLAAAASRADLFWAAVLPAAFVCYGLLPWIPTRPPRSIESADRQPRGTWIRSWNLRVLDRASVQLNTFPSGHAAAAVATALAVGAQLPATGLLFGIIALGIVIGSVTGRYHYAADAFGGILVGLLAFALTHVS